MHDLHKKMALLNRTVDFRGRSVSLWPARCKLMLVVAEDVVELRLPSCFTQRYDLKSTVLSNRAINNVREELYMLG